MSLARWATANGTHAEPAGGSIGQDAAQRPALVVIDAHVLTRSCLVKLLRTEFAEVDIHELDAVSESGKASGFPVRLVALNIQSRSLSEPSVIGDLATLRRAFPHASVALLSEREDDGLAADALKLGISGVFPTTSTGIELAIAGLRLIMAGGIYERAGVARERIRRFRPHEGRPHAARRIDHSRGAGAARGAARLPQQGHRGQAENVRKHREDACPAHHEKARHAQSHRDGSALAAPHRGRRHDRPPGERRDDARALSAFAGRRRASRHAAALLRAFVCVRVCSSYSMPLNPP
jgi:DNA-binding NarL/FixJ family response regulator